MPRGSWGIDPALIDNFDRSTIFAPYTGPIPPVGVYEFRIKTLRSTPKTKTTHPQLYIGLQLEPRRNFPEERKYKGYFIMVFRTITSNNQFTYVPFCDAIGITGREFCNQMIVDSEGNIKQFGHWRNTGAVTILARLQEGQDQNGNARKEIGWMGALPKNDLENEYDDTAEDIDDEGNEYEEESDNTDDTDDTDDDEYDDDEPF
jgi:hypothetical protein